MSVFTADWLALRESADAAARSASITRTAVESLPPGVVHALDLAAGTGSNVRYLASRLPAPQDWLLVDSDDRLLAQVPARMQEARVGDRARAEIRRADLSQADLRTIFEGRTFVTASALLDLVSEAWMASLAALCLRARAVVLFALTYNGRLDPSPAEPEDEQVRVLVNRHQRTDKGFGPALGPDAPARAEQLFAGLGYEVTRASSDWVLGRDQGELQRQLIDGWAAAASDIEPGDAQRIAAWRSRRQAHVAAGRSRLVVGHDDLAGVIRDL